MRDFRKTRQTWFIIALVLGFLAMEPANARITVELAKKCRALMIKAHPIKLYGRTGSEAAQRIYFQNCISRQGKMPKVAPVSKTGQKNQVSVPGEPQ
jgi:hypothetical protein